ncbi:hypothetical protein [Tsukamurella tyrosinosolvens]|uniref:hypothetical protein n=1 Tax=Tsukamurella tyrosinosolvens TaxID=57704 RepID=UPI0007983AD3|nr:hypothetical protein [Tsukamurella tyrosinosolvens]KXP05392.1 hypothetical protein AXK59_07425 [Tsukamurella tyrosinosolvens]
MSDLQALALVKSIRFAAVVLGVSMILLGLMIWQPWASPSLAMVESKTLTDRACVTYKDAVTCNWPK